MRIVSKVVLSALVLLLGGISTAWATDVCFTDIIDGFQADLFVAKAFVMPTAGNCKEFTGFFGDTAELLSGNVCGTSDNQRIRFDLRYSKFRTDSSAPFVFHALAYVFRQNMTGQVEYIFDTGTSGVFTFKKIACPALATRPLD